MACRRLGRAVDLERLRRVFGRAPVAGRAPPRPPAPPDPAAAPTPGQVAWLATLTAAERARFDAAGPLRRAAGAVPGQVPGVAPRVGQPRPDPRGRGGAGAPARGPIGVRPGAGRTVRPDGRAGPPPAPAGAVNIREGEIRGSPIGRPTPLPNPAHAPRPLQPRAPGLLSLARSHAPNSGLVLFGSLPHRPGGAPSRARHTRPDCRARQGSTRRPGGDRLTGVRPLPCSGTGARGSIRGARASVF
jgi:hypothetical protein